MNFEKSDLSVQQECTMVLKDTSILQGELLFLGFPYNRSDIRHTGHVNNQA